MDSILKPSRLNVPLYHLSNELILMLAGNLKSIGVLNALIQPNTDLCKLLDPLLCLRDAAYYQSLAIFRAADHGNENTARKSLQAGSELGYYSSNVVVFGGGNGNDAVFNSDGEKPLLCAAKWEYEAVVRQLLLTSRLDVNFGCRGCTPVLYAAWNGNEYLWIFFSVRMVNLNFAHSEGTQPCLAAESGDKSVVKLLIAAGAMADFRSSTTLYETAVKILLATGRVNPNTTNSERETPLSLAR
ncbi:hypothetical protein N7507_007415 [Penicillium longicatenatum]|nr:hypothetical protein N7507_007415 [Penicillium longicatenatum]